MSNPQIETRLTDLKAPSASEEHLPDMPTADEVAEILTFRTPKPTCFQCHFEFLDSVERRPKAKRRLSGRSTNR